MTPAQLQTLKAGIQADANLTALVAASNHVGIAAYLNGAGTGLIWRPRIDTVELNTAVVWSEFALLTVLLQSTYLAMIQPGFVDATSANIRGGFTSVFILGSQSRVNLIALSQRVPTKGEMIFTIASVCSVFGMVFSENDVARALGA